MAKSSKFSSAHFQQCTYYDKRGQPEGLKLMRARKENLLLPSDKNNNNNNDSIAFENRLSCIFIGYRS